MATVLRARDGQCKSRARTGGAVYLIRNRQQRIRTMLLFLAPSSTKMTSELERIKDYAKDIAPLPAEMEDGFDFQPILPVM